MKKFLPKSLNNPQGFTLIELLVVITIIAILSVIGLVVYGGVQKGSRDARRKADIGAIAKAWEGHYSNATPRYPTLPGSWFSGGTPPRDPQTGAAYTYTGASETAGADSYVACTLLENNTGNYADSAGVTPNATNTGAYYCIKSQQ